MGSRSHDVGDDGIYGTLSEHWDPAVSILSTKYFEKLSQSDFTAVNSGRAGGGILRRILFIIEFHRRLGLSELSEMSSTKNSILL